APASVSYVPMIWGAADVTSATLSQVGQEGRVLLGFNEPDLGSQSNMSVSQALGLWPKLMATGMTLGSPAVASGAATPGGWLDQFMAGAKARGYRVDFIAVHWYGGDFDTGPAVQQLESYLEAIYARYHLPVWLTEFALTSYSGGTASFPAEAQQAAFLTAATKMLDGLSYVQRYAWFALPTSAGSGTTGLFNPGPAVTQVGEAFESAQLRERRVGAGPEVRGHRGLFRRGHPLGEQDSGQPRIRVVPPTGPAAGRHCPCPAPAARSACPYDDESAPDDSSAARGGNFTGRPARSISTGVNLYTVFNVPAACYRPVRSTLSFAPEDIG
ncbi:MAG TPA: glycoside hydrolase family protein, partial [Trebonia sp.]|nr:glycoside hydrolase family protein [Trebonia sp.]